MCMRSLGKVDPDLRPDGKPDDKPSRHRLAPPAGMALLFNPCSCHFDVLSGDEVSTVPAAEAFDLRASHSGATVGRVKVSPVKGTDFAERVEFPSEWLLGEEHGLEHDGLERRAILEMRLKWKVCRKHGPNLKET